MQEHLHLGAGTPQAGLLFGTAQAGTTEILDFQPAIQGDVSRLIAELPKDKRELSLVGYYRTESGDTLHLNGNDLSLAELFFEKPHQVVLLLQDTGFGPPNATFFFHEKGRGMANFAFLEFSFDPSDLAVQERDRIQRSQHSITEHPAAISPIPSKRTARRVAAWALLAGIPLGCGSGFLFMYLREHGLDWLHTPRSRTEPTTELAHQEIPIPPPAPAGFELTVERQDKDLKLIWNRQSPMIAGATSGTLTITEGNRDRTIPLSAAQLRTGTILYAAAGGQIQLQLTVTGPGEPQSESVLVILPPGSPPEVQPLGRQATPAIVSNSTPPPIKVFTPPPVRPHHSDTTGFSMESTPLLPAPSDATPTLPSMLVQAVTAPPAPLVRSSQPPATTTEHTSTPFYPPAVTRSVAAVYPTDLKNLNLKPKTVEIKVAIDQRGRVVKSEYLPGKEWIPNAMVQAAISAARICTFSPARHGDQAVPGELILQFNFKRSN